LVLVRPIGVTTVTVAPCGVFRIVNSKRFTPTPPAVVFCCVACSHCWHKIGW
jgi:hypothetical protein